MTRHSYQRLAQTSENLIEAEVPFVINTPLAGDVMLTHPPEGVGVALGTGVGVAVGKGVGVALGTGVGVALGIGVGVAVGTGVGVAVGNGVEVGVGVGVPEIRFTVIEAEPSSEPPPLVHESTDTEWLPNA